MFDAYIAISPSLQWDDGELVERAESVFSDAKSLNKYVFMSIADEGGEMLENLSRLSDFFRYRGPEGLVWDFRLLEGDDHGTAPIRSTYLGLRMIYPRWRVPRGFYSDPSLAGLQRHYARLSEDYGYAITIPEERINDLGYMVMGNGNTAGAIEIFEGNVEQFPGSANVYDSLLQHRDLRAEPRPDEGKDRGVGFHGRQASRKSRSACRAPPIHGGPCASSKWSKSRSSNRP